MVTGRLSLAGTTRRNRNRPAAPSRNAGNVEPRTPSWPWKRPWRSAPSISIDTVTQGGEAPSTTALSERRAALQSPARGQLLQRGTKRGGLGRRPPHVEHDHTRWPVRCVARPGFARGSRWGPAQRRHQNHGRRADRSAQGALPRGADSRRRYPVNDRGERAHACPGMTGVHARGGIREHVLPGAPRLRPVAERLQRLGEPHSGLRCQRSIRRVPQVVREGHSGWTCLVPIEEPAPIGDPARLRFRRPGKVPPQALVRATRLDRSPSLSRFCVARANSAAGPLDAASPRTTRETRRELRRRRWEPRPWRTRRRDLRTRRSSRHAGAIGGRRRYGHARCRDPAAPPSADASHHADERRRRTRHPATTEDAATRMHARAGGVVGPGASLDLHGPEGGHGRGRPAR